MDLSSILLPEFVIVVAFLYGVGAVIKAVPKLPDWIIPIVLLVLGAVIGVIYGPIAISGQSWVYYMMMGGLAGWSAVGLNQTIKQVRKGDDEDEIDI